MEGAPRYEIISPVLYSSTSLSRFEKIFGTSGTYERIQCPKFWRERDIYYHKYCNFIFLLGYFVLCFPAVIQYVHLLHLFHLLHFTENIIKADFKFINLLNVDFNDFK